MINSDTSQPTLTPKAEQILKGAMPEFLKHGYSRTSMDKVAKAAGVSKQTLYSHFLDKEGLFTALVQHIASQKFCIVWSKPLQGSPEAVLRDLGQRLLLENMHDTEYLRFCRLIVSESEQRPDLAQLFLRHICQPAAAVLTKYLSDRTELKIADPEATSRIFVGSLIHFIMIQEVLHGKALMPMDANRLIDSLIDLIVTTRSP
jgi:AcrR family transcriptional regulator